MLTPGYSLTAPERIVPTLALDFTTAVLDARITFTRALNTATRINSSGAIEIVSADTPRFDYSPTSIGTIRGLLVEESRANLFLNSLIDGTNLSTQSVSLAASAYTLSFYGSGSVVISGGHSATVAGTGDYPNRKTYTFTPTAGSSTFTVSGDVKYAQIELGAFATSFIPTAGVSATRNADVAQITGANFTSFYNAAEGGFSAIGSTLTTTNPGIPTFWAVSDGTNLDYMGVFADDSTGKPQFVAWDNGAIQAALDGSPFVLTANVPFSVAAAYKADSFAMATNGATVKTDLTGALPTVNRLGIGSRHGNSRFLNGHIQEINYWPQRITNAETQAFSK